MEARKVLANARMQGKVEARKDITLARKDITNTQKVLANARIRLEALKEAIPNTVVERDRLMGIEGLASQVYWETLSRVEINWDKKHVLTRFMTIGERQGLVGRNGRHAIRPFHSMLNYVLGLAIVRLRIACIGLELDTEVGIYHEDDEYRESLLYDLVEAMRARIERGLIEMCMEGLEVGWFTYVAQTGRVALVADLRRRLLEVWDKALMGMAYEEVKGFKGWMVERMEGYNGLVARHG
jgi:CRISPR/Cas system-associated endonuclease Cas1